MLVLVDSYWRKAARRAQALGLSEEENPERFAEFVRAAHEEERQRGGLLLKNGFGQFLLKKAVGYEPKAKPHQVKKDAKSKGKPVVGAFASGQRPDHKGPKQGRVIAVGKHGIQLKDDKGRIHKIRHEHVASHQPPVEEKEWAKLAKILADSGEKVDPVSRFSKPEKKEKPDRKSQRSLKTLAKKHKNIDAKRALKEGSPEEVRTLIEHYRNKPKPKKALKKGYVPSDEGLPEEPHFDTCKHCGECVGFGDHAKGIPWNHTVNEDTLDAHHTPEPEQDHSGTDGNQCVGCNKAVTIPQSERKAPPREVEIPDHLPKDIQNMKSLAQRKVLGSQHVFR